MFGVCIYFKRSALTITQRKEKVLKKLVMIMIYNIFNSNHDYLFLIFPFVLLVILIIVISFCKYPSSLLFVLSLYTYRLANDKKLFMYT